VYQLVRIAAALLCASLACAQTPLAAPSERFSLHLFVLADCPISRRLAPEFRRICTDYSTRGVACTLVFVDPDTTTEQARRHLKEFSLEPIPFVIDSRHELVRRAGATVTPEAAVFDTSSRLLYRGRIDDSHVSWTRSRPPTRHDLRDALDAALAGRPVPRPRTNAIGCYISPLPDESTKD
jgi:hypothetical protein